MNVSDEFAVRLARPIDEDRNYCYGTLLKSFRRRGRGALDTDSDNYYSGHHAVVEKLFERGAKLWLAHPKDDEALIVGYILAEPRLLHYVFTRETYRTKPGDKVGIASLLLSHIGHFDAYTHDTADWRSFLKHRYPLARYAPYLSVWQYNPEARDAERLKIAEMSKKWVRK